MAGWAFRSAMSSSGRTPAAARPVTDTTTPTLTVSWLVYRKPPPGMPRVQPTTSMSSPWSGPSPKRSSMTAAGRASTSLTPRV